jgi:predicted ribosomally synthesized peptide with SipW-like signal peptide
MYSLVSVALVAMLVSGATFALFNASTENTSNTFTAGTVTLGTPSSTVVDVANIAPGDNNTASPYTYAVTYTGSLDAWLGLTTSTSGTIFGGATPLAITISDGVNNYLANAADKVVGAAPVASGVTKTFTVTYNMPLAADNSYQGATGTLSMQVKAVQARNNTNSAGTGPVSW